MFVYRQPLKKAAALILEAALLYRTCILSVILLSFIDSVVVLVIEWVQQFWLPALLANQEDTSMALVLFVIVVVVVFVSCYVSMVIFHHMYLLTCEQPKPLRVSLSYALNYRRIFILLRAMLLVFMISIVGFSLFVVPGIILVVFLSLVMPLIVVYQMGAFAAIKRSCQLVWGSWWFSFLIFLPPASVGVFFALLLDRALLPGGGRMVAGLLISTLLTPWVYASQLVLMTQLVRSHDLAATTN